MFGHWEILAIVLVALLLTGFGPPGATEIIIILAVVLLLFGGKRIPELARGLGRSVTNFKAGLKEDQVDENETGTEQDGEPSQKENPSKILD